MKEPWKAQRNLLGGGTGRILEQKTMYEICMKQVFCAYLQSLPTLYIKSGQIPKKITKKHIRIGTPLWKKTKNKETMNKEKTSRKFETCSRTTKETVVHRCGPTLLVDRLQLWLLRTSHPLSLKLRNFLLLSAFAIDWSWCSLDSIDAIGSRYYDGKLPKFQIFQNEDDKDDSMSVPFTR